MRNKLVRWAILCLLAAATLPAWAGNICSESRLVFSGIGGTGSPFTLIKGNAASSAAEAGMGSTGGPQHAGGIGGTGAVAEGGIGGTGIVGVVTGFGSICVNGLEVHYSSDTPVDIDGNMSSAGKLLLGQVVAVSAHGEENNLQAASISVVHALTGPIANMDGQHGMAEVAGVKVRTGASRLAGFKSGEMVKVSGLWMSDGSLAALRIDPASAETTVAEVMGPLRRMPNGRLSVAGVEIMPGEYGGALPAEGNDVRVSGVWEGKHLRVLAVWDSPVDRVLRHASEFYLQGFAVQAGPEGQLRIGAQPVEVRGPGQLGSGLEQLAVAHGRVDAQGKLIVEDVSYHGGPAQHEFGPGPAPGGMDGRPGSAPGNTGPGSSRGKNENGGAQGGSPDAGGDHGMSMPSGGGPGPGGIGPSGGGGGRR